jgi:hypothetical protein
MKTYGGVYVLIHIFFTSAPDRGQLSASRSCRFTPGERVSITHRIGVWVGPRAGLNDMKEGKFFISAGEERRSLGRSPRSQSLEL